MSEYMTAIEKTIDETDGLARMIDSKDLDIAQMKKQNQKFLEEFGEKTSWKKYEELLGKERVTNKRLFGELSETRPELAVMKEAVQNTY